MFVCSSLYSKAFALREYSLDDRFWMSLVGGGGNKWSCEFSSVLSILIPSPSTFIHETLMLSFECPILTIVNGQETHHPETLDGPYKNPSFQQFGLLSDCPSPNVTTATDLAECSSSIIDQPIQAVIFRALAVMLGFGARITIGDCLRRVGIGLTL